MSSMVKSSPGVIQRGRKDKESREVEYKYSKALFQLGANKLLEAVKNDKLLLYPRDLQALYTIKTMVATDDLDDSGVYFQSCNACLFNKSCSLFSLGGDCKFNLNTRELKSSQDITNVMVKLLQIEGDRIQRSLLIEKMEGTIDKEVSSEILQYFDMVQRLKNVLSVEESIEIKVRGEGAMSKIFGDIFKKHAETKEYKDVTPEAKVILMDKDTREDVTGKAYDENLDIDNKHLDDIPEVLVEDCEDAYHDEKDCKEEDPEIEQFPE